MRLPGPSAGTIVLRVAILIVVLVLATWGAHEIRDALNLQIRPNNEQQVHRLIMLGAVAYVGLLAFPFVPGAEIGLAMLAAFGAAIAPLIYICTVASMMLAYTVGRTPTGDFRHGDLESLPWDDDSFDLVTGFNAFQFAGDAAQALREAARVTRPGGRVVIMTWGDPEGMEAAAHMAALKPLLPPPPPGAPGPFALSDEGALRAFAAAGGLTPLEVHDVDTPWHYPDLHTALRGIGSSGVAVKAVQHSGKAAFIDAMMGFLGPFRKVDGSIGFGARARYLVATPA